MGTGDKESWYDVFLDGQMVQINGKGDIREIPKNDKPKHQIGFRSSDNKARSPKNDVCTECRNKGTEEHCQSSKPDTFDCLERDKS